MPELSKVRTCRYCGCTVNSPCVNQSGAACSWIGPDVCDFCAAAWAGANIRNVPKKSIVPAGKRLALFIIFAAATIVIFYVVITELPTAPEGWAFLKGDIHGHQAEPLQPKQAHRSDSE